MRIYLQITDVHDSDGTKDFLFSSGLLYKQLWKKRIKRIVNINILEVSNLNYKNKKIIATVFPPWMDFMQQEFKFIGLINFEYQMIILRKERINIKMRPK